MPKAVTLQRQTAQNDRRALSLALLSWLVPGVGYFLLGRYVRGLLVAACVICLFALGLAMQGQLYSANLGDILDILGWIGDVCAGGLYFLARFAGVGVGNQFVVAGDYGTKFLICAGLLNVLAAADIRDVALGLKN